MRPFVQQPISKDKNVMVQTRKYYLNNHYLTLRWKVKVPGRSLWYTTHRLMVMHPYQISLTYLKRNNYLTLRSKVKVQQRSLWYAIHRLMVMHPHTKYHWPISKETIIWPWGQMSRSKQRSLWYATHLLWSCTHIPNIIDLSRKTKNVMARTRKYYLKNNYLTLRSKVKVQQRSLWYATHHLMDMHPHTKYHWPISKETIIWPWGQRTSSLEVHYGTRHTALWSYTYIPNIINLSRKKQLFDLEVKGQVPTKFITVRDTPPYGHTPTYQILLTYLKRKKCNGPEKKILFKKQLFDLQVKGHGTTKVILVRDTPSYGHAPTYQISLTYLERQKMLWPGHKNTI